MGKKVALVTFTILFTIFSFFYLTWREVLISLVAGLVGGVIQGLTYKKVNGNETFLSFIGCLISIFTVSTLVTVFVFARNPIVTGHPESLGVLTANFPALLGYLSAFLATKKKKPHSGIFPPLF